MAGQAISFENADVVRRLLSPRIHNIRKDPLTFASTVPPNITIINDDIVNSFAQTANLGFSQLAHNLAIQLDGVYTRGSSKSTAPFAQVTDYLTKSYPGKPKPRGVLVSVLVHAEIDGGPWLPWRASARPSGSARWVGLVYGPGQRYDRAARSDHGPRPGVSAQEAGGIGWPAAASTASPVWR